MRLLSRRVSPNSSSVMWSAVMPRMPNQRIWPSQYRYQPARSPAAQFKFSRWPRGCGQAWRYGRSSCWAWDPPIPTSVALLVYAQTQRLDDSAMGLPRRCALCVESGARNVRSFPFTSYATSWAWSRHPRGARRYGRAQNMLIENGCDKNRVQGHPIELPSRRISAPERERSQ